MEDWTDRIHPDDKAFFSQAELQAHLAGSSAAFAVEHRVRSRDGSWKWALARGMVVSQQPDGRPQRMIGTYADISERKKIEEDFKDLLQFNQSVIAHSFSGIMVHRYNGECVLANEAAARISGGKREQLLHHNFRRSQSWRESGASAAAEKALETGLSIDFESPMNTFFGVRRRVLDPELGLKPSQTLGCRAAQHRACFGAQMVLSHRAQPRRTISSVVLQQAVRVGGLAGRRLLAGGGGSAYLCGFSSLLLFRRFASSDLAYGLPWSHRSHYS